MFRIKGWGKAVDSSKQAAMSSMKVELFCYLEVSTLKWEGLIYFYLWKPVSGAWPGSAVNLKSHELYLIFFLFSLNKINLTGKQMI